MDLGCGEGVVREIGQPYEATCPSTSSRTRGYKPPRGKASHHYLSTASTAVWRLAHGRCTMHKQRLVFDVWHASTHGLARGPDDRNPGNKGGPRTRQEAFATVARGGVAAEGP